MSRPATEDDVYTVAIVLLLVIVFFDILGEVTATARHDQVMHELCRIQYPECVVGVDR